MIRAQLYLNSLEKLKRSLGRRYCNVSQPCDKLITAHYYIDIELKIEKLCNKYHLTRKSKPYLLGNGGIKVLKILYKECETHQEAVDTVNLLMENNISAYCEGTKVYIDDGGFDYDL